MKTDSPYDRGDIHINKNDKVLEIGPGHNPTYRSNVIAEKFIDTNYHRCGDVKIYPHQTFVHADISRKTKCSTFAKHFVPKSHLLTQFKM